MWVRIDDEFADHPKVLNAGPLASWLFVCGLCWSNRNLRDGFIPEGQVRRLADVKDPLGLAAKLVEAGLWEVADGGFLIHDYLDYNPSRDDVLARRDRTRERVQRHRNTVGNSVTDSVTNAPCNAENGTNPALLTALVHGSPESRIPLPDSKDKDSPSAALPRAFVKPEAKEIATYFKSQGSSGSEARAYFDHYESNGWMVGKNKMKDWQAAARGWIRRNFNGNGKAAEAEPESQYQELK